MLSSIIPVEVQRKDHIHKLPPLLKSLKDRENLLLNKTEMNQLCESTFKKLSVSSDESAYLEESTRLQSKSTLWFQHRCGRITASKFRSVRFTALSSPSMSLLKSLMSSEPSSSSVTIPALKWGIDSESNARIAYVDAVRNEHENIQCYPAGFHINPEYPHLGASPDGIIVCDCDICVDRLLEIKCPYKYRDENPNSITDPSFCLKQDENGQISLCHEHDYYYQVQGQLAICCKDFCDFVVWTPKGMHIEQIARDESFFGDLKPYLDNYMYFMKILLPVILTGSIEYVIPSARSSQTLDTTTGRVYCTCGGPEEGRMIACDNDDCAIEWFHYKCIGISRKPKGKWFCSNNCRQSFSKKITIIIIILCMYNFVVFKLLMSSYFVMFVILKV